VGVGVDVVVPYTIRQVRLLDFVIRPGRSSYGLLNGCCQEADVDGTPFGRYRLIELLGRGGMGEVWRAYDPTMDRVVALKVLPQNLAGDQVFKERFRREARAASGLDDPHVVPFHDFGEVDGQLYVTMRLIKGRDLETILAEGPLSPERAVFIIEQVAQALQAAHKVGLVHRDIKPSNILLDDNDFAYLIDFGIAHAAGETGLTATGTTIGTWSYMAPERFQSGTADARADIYALACVLYEALTGQLPFPGNTFEQVALAHIATPPPRPSEFGNSVPAALDKVIAKGMAKDPNQRYASTVELARAARDATPVPVHPAARPDQLTAAPIHREDTQLAATYAAHIPQPPSGAPHRATDAPPPTRSKRKWLIALLVVVLIAAAGGGALLLRNVLSPKASAAELVLTGATDPGVNSFMPPAAAPPPTDTQPPPTLQPHGDGTTVTQPLPGDRDGLYGGTLNNAECDRDKMIAFLGSHPAQAGAFVEALNTDPTLFWSGGHPLTAADIPTYLRELTPVVLRLDTRVTNHGFDGTHATALQSVFQSGTAVFVDAHAVPRARCYCGNPLTAPVALTGEPKPVGAPWPGYNPAALAEVKPATATITVFVLVDVVTGQPFNRPAGTTGTDDTPHNQPVSPPQPALTAPTTGPGNQPAIDGTYVMHWLTDTCQVAHGDRTITVTHQGNTLTVHFEPAVHDTGFTLTGTLNADGSFQVSGGPIGRGGGTMRGVFATEGGRTVIRDGTYQTTRCTITWEATKQ
jgi:serine/threonine protein kinase